MRKPFELSSHILYNYLLHFSHVTHDFTVASCNCCRGNWMTFKYLILRWLLLVQHYDMLRPCSKYFLEYVTKKRLSVKHLVLEYLEVWAYVSNLCVWSCDQRYLKHKVVDKSLNVHNTFYSSTFVLFKWRDEYLWCSYI